MVGKETLHYRHDGTADDGGTDDAGAAPVNLPKPLVASEKMVGNIIELKKPINSNAHIDTFPPPNRMATAISTTAAVALKARYLEGAMRCIRSAPKKRPTIAPPQYTDSNLAPVA